VRLWANSGKIPQNDAGFVQAAQHLQDLVVEMRAAVLESRKSLGGDMKNEVLIFVILFSCVTNVCMVSFIFDPFFAIRALLSLLWRVCQCARMLHAHAHTQIHSHAHLHTYTHTNAYILFY